MSSDRSWRYYAALVASALSMLGWAAAVGGLGYGAYAAASGTSFELAVVLVVGGLLVGIGFARVEKRLYRVER